MKYIFIILILLVVAILIYLLFDRYPYTGSRPIVTKTFRDLRELSVAIEEYKANHSVYPDPILSNAKPIQSVHDYMMCLNITELGIEHKSVGRPWFIGERYEGKSDFHDWLAHIPRPYLYYTDGIGWILISTGPDGDYDLNFHGVYHGSDQQTFKLLLFPDTYDPTNGTKSDGDVWRVKQ